MRYLQQLWQFTKNNWRWFVRIAVLWAIISSVAPQNARVILDTPHTVETEKDHVCVHTRLIDEVYEWVIQRSLQLVREMGADTIVEFFPWAYIERSNGNYDWRQADMIVRHAENQGIRIIARLGFVPQWARGDKRDDPTTLNYLPDESFADFADFTSAFAERYAGTIDHLIIWNEPNLAFEWGYREVNPAMYARLLQTVYEPIKMVNSNAVILAGALAPTLEPENSPNGLNDLIYLQQMFDAGAADYMDALAIHTYGFTQAPLNEPAPDELNFRRAELLVDITQQYLPDSRVFITETGWNDHPRWSQAVRPSERMQYTLDAFRYAEENWNWLDEMCLWVFRYPAPTYNYPDNYTLVKTDFQLRPLYFEVQDYARGNISEGALWRPAPEE